MLTPAETKVVLNTLKQRRTWLSKTIESGKVDASQQQEYLKTLKLIDSSLQKLASTAQATASAAPTGARKGKITVENARVLIAEDQEDSRQMLFDMLEDMGIKCIDEAKDGREAFDKIKGSENGYDIVLCDWDMPELSGIEVHKKAKASNTLRDAYFCMVTGMTESEKIREAIGNGVSDYIVKPIDGAILESKINSTIEAKNRA
jgi:two-component system chemotaxis response regulator CheY